MKSNFITSFTAHQLLWESHVSFLSLLVTTLDDLTLADVSACFCRCLLPSALGKQISRTDGWLEACLQAQPRASGWSQNSLLFHTPFLHNLDRGLPATRGLSTCQKLPVTAKLPTMSFRSSTCQWCGHSCRGSTTKTWQLLHQDSLGSFKTAFAVASGGILITCRLFSGINLFFSCLFFL